MTSLLPLRDGLRPPNLDDVPPLREDQSDAVPCGCLCRGGDFQGACPSDLSTCDDVPVMFFS